MPAGLDKKCQGPSWILQPSQQLEHLGGIPLVEARRIYT